MRIRDSAPKVGGKGVHRECTAEQTYERIRPYFPRIGITRVADITWLDRIGIPVYNAIVPRLNDPISVFSGKGVTPADSKTSAVMEAVERYVGNFLLPPSTFGSYEELVTSDRAILRPDELNLELLPQYRDDVRILWVAGYDLLNDETVLVPHCAVSFAYEPDVPRCYRLVTANGLASGNTLEEAICHALAELIERDALTLAELLSSRLPYLLVNGLFCTPQSAERVARLRDLNPHIDPDSIPARAQRLVELFQRSGVEIRLVSITSDIGVPTVLAASWEDSDSAMSAVHAGMGTSPDAEVALVRAITECAQSRAVDIQAMREDFEQQDTEVPNFQAFGKRISTIDREGWPWRTDDRSVSMVELPSHPTDDVVTDIRFMLEQVKAHGVKRVVAVDLSRPDIPVKVARVLAPGLESWGSDRSKMGARAASAWNAAVRSVAEPAAPVPAR